MDFAIYVLKYFATPSVVIAAVAWLFKQIVLQNLNIQSALMLERFRSEMQQDLESVRYQFNRDIEEYKTRFSRLQDKRLDPILSLYLSISELCLLASHIKTLIDFNPEDDVSSYIEELRDLGDRAKQEYLKSLLFLPEPIAREAEKLIANISNAELAYYTEIKGGSGDKAKARRILQKNLTIDYDSEVKKLAKELRFLRQVEIIEPITQRD